MRFPDSELPAMSAIPTAPEPLPGRSRLAALLEHFADIEDPRDLRGRATGLSEAQLLDANADAATILPEGLTRPAHWPEAAPQSAH
jgi:hypothetical protein